MKYNPKITVLMPVYNGGKYLKEAIESILNQSFCDYELLIINDGSTDESVNIIKTYADPRIRLIQNEKNIGLIATLNKGLDFCNGEYIARMDCDDISLTQRLEKQVNFMEDNKDIGLCGTGYTTFDDTKSIDIYPPTEHKLIKASLFFCCCLCHPTVMLRKEILNKYNIRYESQYIHAEDYALWIKCSFIFPIRNIPEILLKYRVNDEGICNKFKTEQMETVSYIHKLNLKQIGITEISEEDLRLYKKITFYISEFKDKEEILKAEVFLCKIRELNRQTGIYPDMEFSDLLLEKWYIICHWVISNTSWGKSIYGKSSLHKNHIYIFQ